MTTHKFTTTYCPSSRIWIFDYDDYDLVDEGLMNGTEEALSIWYEELTGIDPVSEGRGEMELTVTDVAPEDSEKYQTSLRFIADDAEWPEASRYLDEVTLIECWLCPVCQLLFGEKPQKLWVHFQPKNF